MEFHDFISKLNDISIKNLTIDQNSLLRFLEKNDKVIIYKDRQIGVSTSLNLYLLWLLFSKPNYAIGIRFISRDERERFRQIINSNLSVLENLFKEKYFLSDEDVKLSNPRHNIHKTVFPNGSSINYFQINDNDAFRGHYFDLLYISEIGFENNYMKLLQNIMPVISFKKHSRLIISSTELRTIKEDFYMNGNEIQEFWMSSLFCGKRQVLFEKTF